jgi:DHA2 family multidrug resistance protein
MSSWTLDVSIASVRSVMILSGLGTGLIFPVMSKATLGCVEKERMGYAASLYGMMRNTGGAVGISLVSNMLNSREQTHQAYLNEHLTAFSAWRLDQMTPHMPGAPHLHLFQGLATHQPQGFGLISQNFQQQASLLAYNDIYRLLALASALCIPVFLLLKKTDGKPAAVH